MLNLIILKQHEGYFHLSKQRSGQCYFQRYVTTGMGVLHQSQSQLNFNVD